MKVLVLHNKYRHSGGEDAVVDSEVRLLRSHGIDVHEEQFTNDSASLSEAVKLGLNSTWADSSYRMVKRLCFELRPDVVHVHNFWMRLSPSVYQASSEAGVPAVQTLHNFRLLCVRADFLRAGKPCTDCLHGSPWRGVAHRCYRDSFVASAAVARMIATHRKLQTWDRHVNAFVALSAHSKSKFVAGGMDPSKIFVKTNFLEDVGGQVADPPSASETIVFAGRLSPEKGLDVLLKSWSIASRQRRSQLLIIGDGPLHRELQEQAKSLDLPPDSVCFAGAQPYERVIQEISRARAVVLPSLCFENCPRGVLEAFCCGRPVIASRIGALDEFVREFETGLKFETGNEQQLAAALSTILSEPDLADRLGREARLEYQLHYTPAKNFSMLAKIYEFAMAQQPATTITQ
jgi:glycosyltransferase involved in cell wall biosynthesis